MNDDPELIFNEDPMALKQLAKAIGCSYQKILSLVKTGRECIDGRTAKLNTVKTESGMASSIQAYRRFQLELNRRADT